MISADCKLYRDIAQLRSVSRGAAINGISQSAASQYIQELERKLESELLDRGTRPLTVTTAGKLYLDFCREVIRREEELLTGLEQLRGSVEGSVRVASIYSVGLSEMASLREQFAVVCPDCQVHVEYLRPEKVYEAVLADQADLGIVSYPEPSREISVIPWRAEQMAIAAHPDHPLAGRALLRPADLEQLDFVAFDEDLSIRKELDRFLREQGITVTVVMTFDNIQMIKEAVAHGSGLSILPERTMQLEIEQGRLVSIPFHAPGLVRPVGVVHRRKKRFTRAAQRFLEVLEAHGVELAGTF